MSYTPEQWQVIQKNAHAALAADPTNERARAALKASLPHLDAQRQAISAQEMQQAQTPGKAGAFAAGVGQGATFGFEDEATALLAAAGRLVPGGKSPSEGFREQLDANRAQLAAARAAHPLTYFAGELAGGVAVPGVGGFKAVTKLPQLVRPGLLRAAARIGTSAAAGAGITGLEAAGRSEGGIGARARAATDPRVLIPGGIVGGLIPVAGAGVGVLTRGIRRKGREALELLGGRAGPKAAPQLKGLMGVGDDIGRATTPTRTLPPVSQSVPVPDDIMRAMAKLDRGERRLFSAAPEGGVDVIERGSRKSISVPRDPRYAETTLSGIGRGPESRGAGPAPSDVPMIGGAAPKAGTTVPKRGQFAPGGGRYVKPGPHQKAGPNVRVQSPRAPSGIPAGQEKVITDFLRGASPEEIPARLEQMRAVGIRIPAEVEAELIAAAGQARPATRGSLPRVASPDQVAGALSKRGVRGDALLNARDLADELIDQGAKIDHDGMVTLYHRTSKANADAIRRTGTMTGKEDGVFFSTTPTGQVESFGDAVVEVRIPLEKVELDDVFGAEAHVRLPLSRAGARVKVTVAK